MEEDGGMMGNYCKHGTFIGPPQGADYLCGFCECNHRRDINDVGEEEDYCGECGEPMPRERVR